MTFCFIHDDNLDIGFRGAFSAERHSEFKPALLMIKLAAELCKYASWSIGHIVKYDAR